MLSVGPSLSPLNNLSKYSLHLSMISSSFTSSRSVPSLMHYPFPLKILYCTLLFQETRAKYRPLLLAIYIHHPHSHHHIHKRSYSKYCAAESRTTQLVGTAANAIMCTSLQRQSLIVALACGCCYYNRVHK